MRLLSVDTLRLSLGEIDYADVNQLLDTALHLVTQPLQAYLGTEFGKVSVHDVFHIKGGVPSRSSDAVSLRLSRGFVDAETVKVFLEPQQSDLSSAVEVQTSDYVVHGDKGLTFFVVPVGVAWCRVEYTAGFAGDDEEYDEDSIPAWLRAAAINYAAVVFQRLVSEKNRDKDKPAKKGATMSQMPSDLPPMINRYVRWFPTAYDPVYTPVTVVAP